MSRFDKKRKNEPDQSSCNEKGPFKKIMLIPTHFSGHRHNPNSYLSSLLYYRQNILIASNMYKTNNRESMCTVFSVKVLYTIKNKVT